MEPRGLILVEPFALRWTGSFRILKQSLLMFGGEEELIGEKTQSIQQSERPLQTKEGLSIA
jgi:hypothetical protein